MQQNLKQITVLEKSIEQSLSVVVDDHTIPLHQIFREYNCIPQKESELHYLVRDYACFVIDFSIDERSTLNTTKTLSAMASDGVVASNLASTNQSIFFICAYFMIYPSLLFREAVLPTGGEPHSLETLVESVDNTRLWLRTIFGPNSHYAGVVAAMKTLSPPESSATIDSEVVTLANCNELQISSLDVDHFRVVAVLYDLSTPIQRFVSCCDQFGFAIVTNDRSLADLRCEIGKFYSNASCSGGLDICLTFFQRICLLLCPTYEACASLPDQREALLAVLPVLRLLSTLSLYPEIWNFVSEMDWFGEDGLKRFYEEHGNVTNVLLGDSASYEMSLLDSMEPVVRLIFAIGQLRECSNMLSLFKNCVCNEEIVIGLHNGAMDNHIRQVHSKLSEIKDWFSNGVDEVAAAHSLYIAAHRSGHYFIARCKDEATSDQSRVVNERYNLALQFTLDNGDTSEVRILQGSGLEQFIQQLSLIQNENRATSAEMQVFVDQFQVLMRACCNILTMQALGYEKLSISNFVCRASGDNAEDANLLLKHSEIYMRTFGSWLASTREIYIVSLLFWPEELRKIYDLLQILSQSQDGPAVILEHIARLQSLWGTKADRRFQLAALQKYLNAFNERTKSGPTS